MKPLPIGRGLIGKGLRTSVGTDYKPDVNRRNNQLTLKFTMVYK